MSDESNYKAKQHAVLRDHFDADDTSFLERELTFLRAKVYEVAHLPAIARTFMPKATDVPDSAETYVYKTLEAVGKAAFISYEAKDLPRVDIGGKEIVGKVRPLGAAWGFTLNELKEAARLKINLSEAKPRAARDIIERGIDSMLALGSIPDDSGVLPDVLCQGLVNNGVVQTLGVGTLGWWLNPTPLTPTLVLLDLSNLLTKIQVRSSDTWRADTILLPTAHYNYIQQTPFSTLTGDTILTIFKRNNPGVTVQPWYKLNTAGGSSAPRAIAYQKSQDILEAVIPQEFEVVPPEARALELIYNCHARCGGVKIYQPLAVYYADFATS